MADSFFGFDTSFGQPSLEDELDCPLEEDDLEVEEEYDALNDETFGSEATIGDWEKDHEKLAEITESTRPQIQNPTENQSSRQAKIQNSTPSKRNGVDSDIEDNLSHLVLDEADGIVPRPGVWDSPLNLPILRSRSSLPLPHNIKSACTIEELEKGLIGNRTPVQSAKPGQTLPQQQPQKSDGSHLFDSLSLNNKLQINGLPPTRFPPGLGIPPPHMVLPGNMRFPPPQFMPHPRLLANQGGNMLRYPLPPHLMMPHNVQRPPMHGSYCGNFPQPPPHSNLGSTPFFRPDHGMVPGFPNNQSNYQQHAFPHSGNQRNQNRYFHHGDQPNHQPFFKNNQYLHRNHDRNNHQHYQHHHHLHNVNGTAGSEEYDEYAGLMSNRDKQFLITIQHVQLNTIEPYVDDYYYTVFRDRQFKGSREREQPCRIITRATYTPVQFENSLGKLQASTISAPRKVIDMDVVPNGDPQSASQIQQKDTKKTRQLLLEIERLYIILLKLEDLSNPLAILNEKQIQDTKPEPPVIKKTAPELIQSILTSLQQLMQDDKLASMLSIRKGKTLLLRFLPHLSVIEYQNQLEELWSGILRGLVVIGRRDTHLLTSLHSEFLRWLTSVQDFNVILRLARALSDSPSQTTKNNNLAFALTNKFGVSAIASMIEHAAKLYSTTEDSPSSEWSSFVISIVDTIGDASSCVAPCHPIAADTLNQHLDRICNPTTDKYTTLKLLLTNAEPSR